MNETTEQKPLSEAEVRKMNKAQLLKYLQGTLSEDAFDKEDLKEFVSAKISSQNFLSWSMTKYCEFTCISPGLASTLEELAGKIKENREYKKPKRWYSILIKTPFESATNSYTI